ncbi:hypothetical protein SAMN06309944_1792 [Micrococcales bacterium KH10]|nr:hypothetical protein SAMN06309944_1792 [Micrococcales bacterium KH10]
MSLNIKDERTHALVRELAALTGQSQRSVVEDAVSRRLAEIKEEAGSSAMPRDTAIDLLLNSVWAFELEGLHDAEQDLYDESGLPR